MLNVCPKAPALGLMRATPEPSGGGSVPNLRTSPINHDRAMNYDDSLFPVVIECSLPDCDATLEVSKETALQTEVGKANGPPARAADEAAQRQGWAYEGQGYYSRVCCPDHAHLIEPESLN